MKTYICRVILLCPVDLDPLDEPHRVQQILATHIQVQNTVSYLILDHVEPIYEFPNLGIRLFLERDAKSMQLLSPHTLLENGSSRSQRVAMETVTPLDSHNREVGLFYVLDHAHVHVNLRQKSCQNILGAIFYSFVRRSLQG